MAFPGLVHGTYGDEKVAQSTKINGFPLGIKMVLPDGREFVHAHASATALVGGSLYQQVAIVNSLFRTGATIAAVAVGATSVTATISGTVLAANQFAEGFLYVASTVGTGGGITYKVKSHPAAASTATCVFSLADNEKVIVAMNAGTATVGLRDNEFENVLATTANTTGTGALAGVATRAVTASYYCWLQRKGVAACLTDATLVIGEPAVASSAAAGAFGPFVASATSAIAIKSQTVLGMVVQVAASTGFSLIDLALP